MGYMEELESLGVNVTEGKDRVMGDEALYEMMLGMFVDTVNGSPVTLEEFDKADREELIGKVHTLKGLTGNLSLTPLYEGYLEALGLLRADKPKEAKAVTERLLPIQEKIIDCIQKNQG